MTIETWQDIKILSNAANNGIKLYRWAGIPSTHIDVKLGESKNYLQKAGHGRRFGFGYTLYEPSDDIPYELVQGWSVGGFRQIQIGSNRSTISNTVNEAYKKAVEDGLNKNTLLLFGEGLKRDEEYEIEKISLAIANPKED